MSSFSVNKIYTYSSANIYTYLGRVPVNDLSLENTFKKYHITPTGSIDDLRKLNNVMYKEYTHQIQTQISNQKERKTVPWENICKSIGVNVTGDYETDLAAFNNAINLLSQNTGDNQINAYLAGLKNESRIVFGLSNKPDATQSSMVTFETYKSQYLV